jgi:hypothetical protein
MASKQTRFKKNTLGGVTRPTNLKTAREMFQVWWFLNGRLFPRKPFPSLPSTHQWTWP